MLYKFNSSGSFSIRKFSPNYFAGSSKYPIFVNHFRSMMTLMKSSKCPIDPNKFIARLGSFLSKELEKPFITNKEQDVPEVLEPILEHLTGSSVFLRKKITIVFLQERLVIPVFQNLMIQKRIGYFLSAWNLQFKKQLIYSIDELIRR